ncbi:MAG: thiazole biosynthesis adenylyltransferase ThiF [Candidatus Brocadia sp. AMX2]|uniref:Molybdopterin biosynthesis protein n=1 Tax=Candidatus Brocadia sinica JPN1 TaxID=1197129 RepID=A0ABQ0K2N1_9BACT|nr:MULTISPECIES: ThiF family adenylyltransferase [Brocadia]KXK25667.1 MAG: putative molybdopterin biosynthesis protein MoeB [Candidatus Brocadia sinica]MBC6932669.1 thiazole biosynthesis adenylyltransferase ThiF [Candidatus Brocadia sp.]MBL1169561.1 thiazole biosynthesis adenylyltransferase ThiF [Candidatus Brocadia sp. AMX1]NOG43006.1 thiazole biosynthesis adenylyltransferase ThiF [Planctomycetota bacterium]KAA0243898.1 MAG: thiazole biosynthesis adenylyltransferase ThiF [Candidatus Brocadia 
MSERYARQILFYGIGSQGQKILMQKSAVLVGCGALGCTSANLLVRSGVKCLKIIDRDYIEESNLQRQSLFDEEDISKNLPKAVAAQKKLQKVNSHVRVESFIADLNPSNIETLLETADIVIDGTDNFETRFLVNDYCVKKGIPWIYGACIGGMGLTMNIVPSKTPCFRCILENIPSFGTIETCDTEGIIAPIASMIASIQVAEALKILTDNFERLRKGLLQIDLWRNEMKRLYVEDIKEKSDCITCKQRNYEFLLKNTYSLATSLCGRNAVQILHSNGSKLDLKRLAVRLEKVGDVSFNSFLLRLKIDKYELTVFTDGRSIITGTNDASIAKGLYAKYIGM